MTLYDSVPLKLIDLQQTETLNQLPIKIVLAIAVLLPPSCPSKTERGDFKAGHMEHQKW